MSPSRDRQIVIQLAFRSSHPALLQGLDAWLRLGLISDAFVRQLCEEEFVCAVPERTFVTVADEQAEANPSADITPQPDLLPVPAAVVAAQRPPAPPNLIAQVLQAFMAEISVVWLLFLGVFLVVVSSGVLAATQWQNVSPLGQYGILLVYTLVFGLASSWTRQRVSLHLTSQMLAIATLLLVPVNFWMMDGLRLWRSFPGVGVIGVAAIVLTLVTILLLRQRHSRVVLAVVILLSWLHWGWSQAGIPLLAVYLGTISASAVLFWQDAHRSIVSSPLPPDQAGDDATAQTVSTSFNLGAIALVVSVLLLLGRALFVVQISISQLGLAIGICGWLLGWLGRGDRARLGWSRGGSVLLILAWMVTVGATPPWQAVVITGLGLWLLLEALWQTGRSLYLATSFLVGLQLVWLLWRLLPSPWLNQLVQWATDVAGSTAMPFALVGLGFFPYLWVTSGFAFALRRHDRAAWARDLDLLSLALGGFLIAISFGNPLVRSLTLTLATCTLTTAAIYRRPLPVAMVYLTHGTALATLFAWINTVSPQLSPQVWVAILLAVMTLEWAYMAMRSSQAGEAGVRSAWHFGLVLAGVSYALWWDLPASLAPIWKLLWLLTPALLTGLGYRDRLPVARSASWLSIVALGMTQPLLIWDSSVRFTSLGIATLLMVFNTAQLQHRFAAILTVGVGLGFWAALLEVVLPDNLVWGWVLVLLSGSILLLWGLRGFLLQSRSPLSQLYRSAMDGWAIVLLLLAFFLLGLSAILGETGLVPVAWEFILAAALLVLATTYRTWQTPSNGGWLAIAGSIELLTIHSLLWAGRSLLDFAIANIVLGYLAQLVGDAWMRRASRRQERRENGQQAADPASPAYPASWHLIPLVYGLIGLGLARWPFTAATGLYTIVVAVLGCLVGRRSRRLQPVTYLALAGVSFGAYDLLVYQLLQAKGDHPGDGVTLLAGLAIALTFAYYLLQRFLRAFLRVGRSTFTVFTQLHWLLGSLLLLPAVSLSVSQMGQTGWTAVAALLALYALILGNQRLTAASIAPSPELWTYLGILDALAAIASLLWLLLPNPLLIDWAGAIAAILAIAFYSCPWRRWGWSREPWRQAALLLPGFVLLLTSWGANLQSLLLVAAVYAWFASAERQIRFSYISVLLANWAVFRLFSSFNLTQPLWYTIVIGSSVLYLVQVDPALQAQQRLEQRHWLRSLATALICLTGFYQAEAGITGLSPFLAGFVAIAVEFSFIVLGLWQKVRAFLYVGTLTFMLQILWQLWRFVRVYSLLLWLIGIVLGLILIWVAATFEARRAQANALLQHWVTELEDWQ